MCSALCESLKAFVDVVLAVPDFVLLTITGNRTIQITMIIIKTTIVTYFILIMITYYDRTGNRTFLGT